MGLFTRKGRPEIIEYPAVAPKTIDGYDAEKADHPLGHVGLVTAYEDGSVPKENFVLGETKYHRLQRFAAKCRIEQRGIERVPNDERHDTALINVGSLWFSANLVVSSFAIGVVGPVIFQLGFIDSVLTILFINLLGIMPVCFFSTFGSVFGLRQMVLSRFYFGWYGVKLIALLNILACIGWSAVNVIVGAQLINAVNGSVPGYAGIIIIAACTLLITLFGYKIVHYYERWSWIPSFIVFLIVVGEFAHQGSFHETPLQVGAAEAGSVLSFAATVFGFATGWTSYAADYTCYQPVTASRVRVFMWTWLGLIVPLLFVEMLGAACATAIANNPAYAQGYTDANVGGLLGAIVIPPLGRFGEFCVVILALSIVANNCPNIYSVSLSLQLLSTYSLRVPRFIWTLLGTLAYCAIAIPAYYRFEQVLTYFMLFIGYWLAIYEGISLTEHFVFRRGIRGYEPADYLNKNRLPVGAAAVLAFGFGIMGAVLGMSQPWFVGPIGRLIGDPIFGGDVGFELGFGFSVVSYLVLRTLEKRHFGR